MIITHSVIRIEHIIKDAVSEKRIQQSEKEIDVEYDVRLYTHTHKYVATKQEFCMKQKYQN